MKTYIVTVQQTETRKFTFKAASEAEAKAKAEAWNESPTGDCPEGCDDYDFGFVSDTIVEEA
jgi:hypothetical protein